MAAFHAAWKEATARKGPPAEPAVLRSLVGALVADATSPEAADGSQAHAAELAAAPAVVKAHYAKGLLDTLTASLAPPKRPAADELPSLTGPAERWRLFAALLPACRHPSWAPNAAVLLPAATHACLAAAQADAQEGLPQALLAALQCATARFPLVMRKSLDPSVALAVAALEAALACRGAWDGLAAFCLASLRRQCLDAGSQRRVFAAACRRLLLPASRALAEERLSPELRAAAAQALDAALFHPSHVQGMADVVSSEAARWAAAGFAALLKPGEPDKLIARQCQWQLLLELRAAVAGIEGAGREAAMAAAPWLLERWTVAVRQAVRLAAAESAAAGTRKARGEEAGGSQALGQSVDFAFFSALLQPVLCALRAALEPAADEAAENGKRRRKETLSGSARKRRKTAAAEGGAAAAPEAEDAVSALAGGAMRLLEAVQRLGVYRPTEDAERAHLALLGAVAEAAVAAADAPRGVLPAARLVGAVLAIEHRALEPLMPQLWPIVLAAAAAADAPPTGDKACDTAAAVAAGMVRAFAELRQLGALLDCLSAAIPRSLSAAASNALCSYAFTAALSRAVQESPPGQAGAIIGCAAECLAGLQLSEAASPANLARAGVCLTILTAIQVTLPTAAAVAAAVEQLLSSRLSGLLQQSLAAAEADPQPAAGHLEALGLTLRVYTAALELHSACAASRPQTQPLPGQGTGDSLSPDAGLQGGHFAAAGLPDESAARLAALAQRWAGADAGGDPELQACLGGLQQAVLGVLLARAGVVSERLLRQRFCCPLPGPTGEEAEEAAATGASADASAAELADASALEAELRELAGAAASLAAGPAAAALGLREGPQPAEMLVQAAASAQLLLQWALPAQATALLAAVLQAAASGSGDCLLALQELCKHRSPQLGQAWSAAAAQCLAAAAAGMAEGLQPGKLRRAALPLLQCLRDAPGSGAQAQLAASLAAISAQCAATQSPRKTPKKAAAGLTGEQLRACDAAAALSRLLARLGSSHLAVGEAQALAAALLAALGVAAAALPRGLAAEPHAEARLAGQDGLADSLQALAAALAALSGRHSAAVAAAVGEAGPSLLRLLAAAAEACQAGGVAAWQLLQALDALACRLAGAAMVSGPEAAQQLLAVWAATAAGAAKDALLSAFSRAVAEATAAAQAGRPAGGKRLREVIAGPEPAAPPPAPAPETTAACTAALAAAVKARLAGVRLSLQDGTVAGDLASLQQSAAVLCAAGHLLWAQRQAGSEQGVEQAQQAAAELAALLLALASAAGAGFAPEAQAAQPGCEALLGGWLAGALECLVRQLAASQRSSGGGAADDPLLLTLATAHTTLLSRAAHAGGQDAAAALSARLAASATALAEAATLAQTRLLLERALGGVAAAAGLPEALPHLQMLHAALEASGAPAKQRQVGEAGDCMVAALTALLHTAQPQAPLESPAADAAAEAAASLALRCLESAAARPQLFCLRPATLASLLDWATAPQALLSRPGAFARLCRLLAALLRHRCAALRRLTALLASACRRLLHALGPLCRAHPEAGIGCAAQLSNLYAGLAEQQEVLGVYLPHFLADYITIILAPESARTAELSGGGGGSAGSLLPEAPWRRLREGACLLFGACTPPQVQHLHAVLGKSCGGSRRAALAALRTDFERHHKFVGKI